MFKLYNSLTQKKEQFTPLNKNQVSLYVCGITPYDTTHLGHAFTYIAFDILVRYLKYKEYDVLYTQNVTDINDRDNDILKRAKEQNIPWQELCVYWTKKFLDDMEQLNWIMPTNYLKASEHIPDMVKLIQKILNNEYAYLVNGSVYLDIEKVSDFGKLSKLSKEQMQVIANNFEEDTANKDKRHPLDITLWRATSTDQQPHIPSFESPFGLLGGRPGWHIECSAMATEKLGEQVESQGNGEHYRTIDIHGGGIDLIYPHHESEIAQSEAATGKIPFVKYWMHTGAVSYKGQKMSKSLGNLIMVSDLLKTYSANVIRFLLLSYHYREAWEFKEEELQEAQQKINLIIDSIKDFEAKDEIVLDEVYKNKLEEYLDDDLNTPDALNFLIELAAQIKSEQDISRKVIMQKTLFTFTSLLGFS